MKKFLLLLGMVTCLIGTAACGKADQVQESQLQIDEASLINYSDQVVNALNEIVTGGMQDQYASRRGYQRRLHFQLGIGDVRSGCI